MTKYHIFGAFFTESWCRTGLVDTRSSCYIISPKSARGYYSTLYSQSKRFFLFSNSRHIKHELKWYFPYKNLDLGGRSVAMASIVLLTGSWTSESARSAPGLKETALTTSRAAERRIASGVRSCSSCCGYSSTTGCKKQKLNILQRYEGN